jgi:hypothetical protein
MKYAVQGVLERVVEFVERIETRYNENPDTDLCSLEFDDNVFYANGSDQEDKEAYELIWELYQLSKTR